MATVGMRVMCVVRVVLEPAGTELPLPSMPVPVPVVAQITQSRAQPAVPVRRSWSRKAASARRGLAVRGGPCITLQTSGRAGVNDQRARPLI